MVVPCLGTQFKLLLIGSWVTRFLVLFSGGSAGGELPFPGRRR